MWRICVQIQIYHRAVNLGLFLLHTLTRRTRQRWQPVLHFLWNSFACFLRGSCVCCDLSSRPPARESLVVTVIVVCIDNRRFDATSSELLKR